MRPMLAVRYKPLQDEIFFSWASRAAQAYGLSLNEMFDFTGCRNVTTHMSEIDQELLLKEMENIGEKQAAQIKSVRALSAAVKTTAKPKAPVNAKTKK